MRTVGRLRELELLGRVVAAAQGGAGGHALVVGEAGIGKSNLLDEIAERAKGSIVLRGSAWEEGGSPPSWPWREALDGLGETIGWDEAIDRFALYRRVVAVLRDVSRQRPVTVLLDDLHAADADTLRLSRFVARSIRELPVAMIAAARPSPLLGGVAHGGVQINLGPLTEPEIAALAEGAAPTSLTRRDRDAIVLVAEGNPLVAHELAVAAGTRGDVGRGLPPQLRDAVAERIDALAAVTRDVLEAAAVLGRRFVLADLAGLLSRDVTGVVEDLAPAAAAGIVVHDAGRSLFSHQLVRDAVYEGVPLHQRLDLHARAAAHLANAGTDRLDEQARHLTAAVPLVDAAHAVEVARRAAHGAYASGAFGSAADTLVSAIALTDDHSVRLALLLDCGDAQLLAGRVGEAYECFDEARILAVDAKDTESLTHALLGRTELVPSTGQARELAGLIEPHLTELPTDPAAIRLLARYARLHATAGGMQTASAAAAEAVDAARRLGDDALLSDVLTVRHFTLGGPDDLQTAGDVSAELAAAAARSGDTERIVDAEMEVLIDSLRAGDIPAVDRSLEHYRQWVGTTGRPRHIFFLESRRAMRAFLAGRLAEGGAALDRAYRIGTDIEEPDTEMVFHGARTMVVADLADNDEARADAEGAEAVATMTGESRLLVFAAYLRSTIGEVETASDLIDRAIVPDFSNIARDGSWLMMMAMAAHAIARSSHARRAQALYDLLLPYRGRVVVNDGAVAFGGVVDDYLGQLANALDQPDRAREHLDNAIAAYERLGATLFLARARQARDHIIRPDGAVSSGPARQALLRRLRGEWECGYEGETFHLRNMVGLHHLAHLIAANGAEVHALQLAAPHGETASRSETLPELLDPTAKSAYRQRVADLREDIDEADANHDFERADRLRSELDSIIDQLRSAVGLGGRSRTVAGDAERARVAVRKAIIAALDRLAEHDTSFAQHLRIHIQTGLYCRYEPDPQHPIAWKTDG